MTDLSSHDSWHGKSFDGTWLCEHPDVALISFTGPTSVGRLVGAAAGRTLKKVSFELGGNNALIVLDDAEFDAASSAGAWGRSCTQVTNVDRIVSATVAVFPF